MNDTKQYIVAGRTITGLHDACAFASFIAKISGIIVAVEEAP